MLVRRITTLVALSLWLGGVTLYGLVVVPAGGQVLGSATAQGFITDVVTTRLNLLGVGALVVLAWNTFRPPVKPLVVTWLLLVATQIALFLLHPYVTALLDPVAHRISDHDAFYARHRIYLLVTAAQWLAAIAYTGFALARWRDEDR